MPVNRSANIITLVASAARTTTGNSGVTGLIGTGDSYEFILDTTAASGTTPTLDVAIQHSPDNGTTWYVWNRFTQVTGTGTRLLVANPLLGNGEAAFEGSIGGTTGVVKQNGPLFVESARILWTIGGTNPSFTFSVREVVSDRGDSSR